MKQEIVDKQTELYNNIKVLLDDFEKETGMVVETIENHFITFEAIHGHLPVGGGIKIKYMISSNLLEEVEK